MINNRIIVKIGTNTITNIDGGINIKFLESISKQILHLKKNNVQIIIVSSGAIGLGVKCLGLPVMPREITDRQAAAAIGQPNLMHFWQECIKAPIAQLLLTYESFSNRKTYLNLTRTINTLLLNGIIPIINENDPISFDEIGTSFGDNDKLSALVASKVNAQKLIILSNISGLYTRDPKKNINSTIIPKISDLTEAIKNMAYKSSSGGTGGMITKLEAAEICMNSGVSMVIANGSEPNILIRIMKNEPIGTVFIPKYMLGHKHRWIKFTESKGKLIVDSGAAAAINSGKNLLPIGIKNMEGNFQVGEIVDICNKDNFCFAKAIVNYDSKSLHNIIGKSGKDNVYSKGNIVLH